MGSGHGEGTEPDSLAFIYGYPDQFLLLSRRQNPGRASSDGTIHLQDAAGKPIRYFKGEPYSHYLFTPDSKTLLGTTVEAEKFFRWDIDTGKELTPIDKTATRSVVSLAASYDGKLLAWGDGYGVRILDLEGAARICTPPLRMPATELLLLWCDFLRRQNADLHGI